MKRQINVSFFIVFLLLMFGFTPHTSVAAEEHRYIIGFQEEINSTLIEQYGGTIEQSLPSIQAVAALFPTEINKELASDPAIAYIEEDKQLTIHQTIGWGVKSTNAPTVWKSGLTGKGVKVAVIDTGVNTTHPDLEIQKGISVVSYTTSFEDDNGHGTNVAGILAAKDNDIGIIGMAPDVELYVVKAFDSNGDGYHSHLIKGIEWAVNEGVDIINLSVGSKAYSIGLLAATNDAYKKGVIIVAAAGNGGNAEGQGNKVEFPAAFESTIAVAAIDKNDRRASFSATGPQVEVAAPGVRILTTSIGGGYEYNSGTSMAVPHVSGHLALLKEAYPKLTASELRDLLHEQTIDTTGDGRNHEFGYGKISLPTNLTEQVSTRTRHEQAIYSSAMKSILVGQRVVHHFGDETFPISQVSTAKMLQRGW